MKPSTPSGSKEVKNLSDDLGPNTKAKATKNQRVLGILDHTSPIRNAYSVEETIFKRFAEIELQQENHVWIRMGNHTHSKSMQSMIKFLSFTIKFLSNTIEFYGFGTIPYVRGIL